MLAGIDFRSGELSPLVVRDVSPREAVADHFHVHEAITQIDAAHLALVAVHVDDLDAHSLAEHFVSKILSRLGPERLALFWRIDSCEANLVLHFIRIEDGERVAVGNLHDLPGERVGLRLRGEVEAPAKRLREQRPDALVCALSNPFGSSDAPRRPSFGPQD
jgi:hypothetical protein